MVLRFYPDPSSAVHVRLGVTTAQDLILDLGPPLRTFYREDDRMAIHSRTRTDEDSVEPSCESFRTAHASSAVWWLRVAKS